ncbi:GHKL domain-containing protein [Clostridium boliviensis]|uniref:GHKL domain-containing protein n=1 Tax=Clostridium boliviensis TaxID=318465 RepID=A0ABU4GSQ8_9CLOT|nr:GHKL domain-containing protein [Clostridium boliviensis]MDW2800679.1 GHKL domain-containing protein [Clostridium boliviensis]
MNNTIFSFIFSLTESVLLYCLISCSIPCRFHGRKKLYSIFLATVVNTLFVFCLPDFLDTIRFILFFLITMILTSIVYLEKTYILAFFILVANYVFLISDILVGNFSSYIIKIDIPKMLYLTNTSFGFSILAKLLNIILIIIFINYFGKNKFGIPPKYWITMDIIVLLFSVILQFIMIVSPVLQRESNKYSIYISIISIGFLIISGLIIFFFGKIFLYHEQEKENYILSIRNLSLVQQLSYHESATTDLKRIRHDINKNLTNISYLLKQNNIDGAVAYIEEITNALERTKTIVSCGNDIIDAILNYKIAVCRQHNIDIQIDIDQVPHLSITPIDLTAILSNILDNSIEAVDIMDTEKRYISGKIFCYKNYLSIVVKNPYSKQLIIENNKIKTRKTNTIYHGYGLASIKLSVEKYSGLFKVYTENRVFKVVVMLPIKINP